ncbi:MAG TPA: hypothetical protein PKO06_05540 [Candidatus Ozemobacteraceae bacterium]|nr:hypothetical protein [Candidatus Ozemobacteraceae bacterium]
MLVPLLALQRRGCAFERIDLLATPFTKNVARQIADYSTTWIEVCTITEIESDNRTRDERGPKEMEMIRRIMSSEGTLVFNLNGGMNFQIACGLLQAPLERTRFLYSDSDRMTLFRIDSKRKVHTEDLPLCSEHLDVLRLQRVAFSPLEGEAATGQNERVSVGVKIGKVRFDAVVNIENTLRFYVFLERPFLEPGDTVKEALLRKTRDIMTLATGRSRFAQLFHREVIVVTARKNVQERLETEGRGKIRVERWPLERIRATYRNFSGWVRSLARPQPVHSVRSASTRNVEQRGKRNQQGTSLAVFLGSDILPTLIAIRSHAPSNLYLFYDAGNTQIVQTAELWMKEWVKLGVSYVAFISTGFLDLQLLEAEIRAERLEVNSTPGTKLQGALLILLGRMSNPEVVSVWTINNATRRLSDLTGHLPDRPLKGPSPLKLLTLRGENIHQAGEDEGVLARRKWIMDALTNWFRRVSESGNPLQRFSAGQNAEYGEMTCHVTGNDAFLRSKTSKAEVRIDLRQDQWFERWVGWRFFVAGKADEVAVRLRTQWRHESDSVACRGDELSDIDKPYVSFKSDLDVVLRFGHRYMVVSCKSGKIESTNAHADETAATAAMFGRFTVPVLVQLPFTGNPERLNDTWRLGGKHLLDDAELYKLIEHMLASHSTTRPPQ